MDNLETRLADKIEIRSEDEGIIEGRAVPYNQPTNIGGYVEEFKRGAFEHIDPASVALFWRHKEAAGRVISLREKDDGLYFVAKYADSAAGRMAFELARSGVDSGVSIGFNPHESEWNQDRTRVVRHKANLIEISTTDRPAYKAGKVLATREESTKGKYENMEPENKIEIPPAKVETRDERVNEVLERMEQIEKVVTDLGETRSEKTAAEPLFRSFGEYFQARVRGDEKAEVQYRALVDNTLGDNTGVNPPNWMSNIYGIVNRGRPVASAFGIGTLSASGMTETWPVVTSMPTVDLVVDENDDIDSTAFTIEPVTGNVKLYAGGGALSRLVIDRSAPSYIDATGRAMAAAYGKRTEAAFVSALIAGATASDAFAGATLSDYIEGLVNALADINAESEFAGNLVVVSRDVFTTWASLAAGDGRSAFSINADGSNTIGTMNIPSLSGSLAGIPVLMSHDAAAGTVLVASTDAAEFREASGAPFELNSDEVLTLKKGYAVYGYGLSAVYSPSAIRSIALAA